jgi:allophanate hydrolase subunit 2
LDADLDRFAQVRPGDAFRFRLVTAEGALSHARLMGGMRARWLDALAQRS